MADHKLCCPECSNKDLDSIFYVEAVPAIRRLERVEDDKILVSGLIDRYDYELSSCGTLVCYQCHAEFKPPLPLEFV